MTLKTRCITITEKQSDFIDKTSLNFSKWVREKIDEEMSEERWSRLE